MPYRFNVDTALHESNKSGYDTFEDVYELFQDVSPHGSPWNVTSTTDHDGIVIATVDHRGMNSATIRVDPATGSLTFVYSPATGNPWQSKESKLKEIYGRYVYNPEAIEARRRGREARGLLSVMKPKEEGLDVGKQYLPPGVPANIASFLTGQRGSIQQQTSSLKAKATGTGRRKVRKSKSKTRAIRRTSLGRKTRRLHTGNLSGTFRANK